MKTSKFTEHQIVFAIKQSETGTRVKKSSAPDFSVFHNWKSHNSQTLQPASILLPEGLVIMYYKEHPF
ncbi:hypothetical protein HNP38_003599 [Chryseobacterium defluvii]|uniref:Transposase n=1 Tax=Chryseobacterium defluvii TaxID=160396 RepID=A0A840KK23_9FLAO|nr:hypothetical protein [Chryseobacterium defluvii]